MIIDSKKVISEAEKLGLNIDSESDHLLKLTQLVENMVLNAVNNEWSKPIGYISKSHLDRLEKDRVAPIGYNKAFENDVAVYLRPLKPLNGESNEA